MTNTVNAVANARYSASWLCDAERHECFGGTVGGGRESVGADADPGQECDERDVLPRFGRKRIARRAEERVAQPAFTPGRHVMVTGALANELVPRADAVRHKV